MERGKSRAHPFKEWRQFDRTAFAEDDTSKVKVDVEEEVDAAADGTVVEDAEDEQR